MLLVSYGVNASGKDTIFKKLASQKEGLIYISSSKILMNIAGIIDQYNPALTPSREEYKQLEDLSDHDRDYLMNKPFFEKIKALENEFKYVVIPMHLSILKATESGQIYYDQPQFNPWLRQIDKFIYIRCPIRNLQIRIEKDTQENTRERLQAGEEALKNQILQTEGRWRELKEIIQDPAKFSTVSNFDGKLEMSVEKVWNKITQEELVKENVYELRRELKVS
jgi:muconolactone delta-isomerase